MQRVERELKQHFAKLDQLTETIGLEERAKARIEKARRLIPKLLATLAFVFSTMTLWKS